MAQLFDEAELLDRVDNDVAFLADTVQMLETDGRALMLQLNAAVTSSDAAAIGRTAHTLKGMISNFCAPSIQTLALEVEKASDGAAAAAASAKLEPELEALIVELAAFVRA
ncbi:MAG TPA: Hpt domain-containing protein, partial [Humisphaera sp.]|nr:Hpt domain-containing protein [Humisphaera sp.]